MMINPHSLTNRLEIDSPIAIPPQISSLRLQKGLKGLNVTKMEMSLKLKCHKMEMSQNGNVNNMEMSLKWKGHLSRNVTKM